MTIPTVQVVRSEKANPIFAAAFAAGCGAVPTERYESGPWAGFGSPQTWDDLGRAVLAGETWFYGDKPYFLRGARKWFRVTRNALQCSGVGEPRPDRLRELRIPPPRPMRRTGSTVVVCLQSEFWHRNFNGLSANDWGKMVCARISQHTERPIVVRTKKDPRPLRADLADAHCVVTYTSNCAVDALMEGVPAIVLGPSAATPMCRTDLSLIEDPLYPSVDERRAWSSVLAANQWSIEEMRSGKCWRELTEAA